MVKTIRLTWGFSLCKFKISPPSLLESKQDIVSFKLGSRNYNISTNGRGRSRLHSRVRTAQAALPASNTRNEDIELAVLVTPPELVSRCTSKQPFPIESDARTRVFVYLVSLALSLAALSILKLHKLLEWLLVDTDVASFHGSISDLKSKSSVIAEILKAAALRYKKSLNSPTYTADAGRVLPHGSVLPTSADATSPTTPTFFSAHAATAEDHQCLCSRPSSSTLSQSPKTVPPMSSDTNVLGFCHHWPSASQPCLLCYLASSGDYSLPLGDRRQRTCSESKYERHQQRSHTYRWPSPSRPNAGICRTQVSVGHAPGCLSVEVCSASISRLSGLELAAALSKQKVKHRQFVSCGEDSPDNSSGPDASAPRPNDFLTGSTEEAVNVGIAASSAATSPTTASPDASRSSPFSRRHNGSPKLVACVAPTSQHIVQQPVTTTCSSQRSHLHADCYPKKLRIPLSDGNLQVVEEVEEHLEAKASPEEALEATATATTETGSHGLLITTTSATLLARAAVLAVHRKIFENRGVGVSIERVDAGTSPIPPASPSTLDSPVTTPVSQKLTATTLKVSDDSADNVSEVDDLELDDDGVWFSHDLPPHTTHRLTFSPYCDDVEREEDDEVFGINISPILNQRTSCSSLTSLRSRELDADDVEEEEEEANFSDLVALTTSISDDLMKLETGCHELIYRVQANRIELDSVHDRLGYVWNNKDILVDLDSVDSVYSSPLEASLPERSLTGPAYMEDSFTSFASSNSRSMIRHTPLGHSFVSDSGETPRNRGEGVDSCYCNCHQSHTSATTLTASLKLIPEQPAGDRMDTILTNANTGDGPVQISFDASRQSPGSDSFFNPHVSFEDEDAVQWCDSRPLIRQKQ